MVAPGKCKAVNRQGKPCSASATKDGFCFWHSPKTKRARDKARKLGGVHRKRVASSTTPSKDISTPADVVDRINLTLRELANLEPGFEKARVTATVLRVSLEAMSQGDIEQRVRALEELLSHDRGSKKT